MNTNPKLLLLMITCSTFWEPNLFAKSKNPEAERFKDSFIKFNQEDNKQKSKFTNLTLFTGSSSIRRWHSLSSDFPQVNLLNRGFGGAHISDVLHFYDQLFLTYRPKMIVLYCGENDLWSGKTVKQVHHDFHTLWIRIQKDLPSTSLIYLSCKPSPKRISKWQTYQALNLRIKNKCLQDPQLYFVDLTPTLLRPNLTFYPGLWDSDNLHVNQAGYDRWKNWLKPILYAQK
ncbi:GDSL-type esterase/lipase family protein [Opitutales bacterium]|nr:GDSL-type esterase/lipase family protein [Opitutales bacterium]